MELEQKGEWLIVVGKNGNLQVRQELDLRAREVLEKEGTVFAFPARSFGFKDAMEIAKGLTPHRPAAPLSLEDWD